MILYVLKQNKNSKSAAYGKYFAYPVIEETVNLDDLAEHMSSHNTPYSKGAIKGMLTDMVSCIKELLLEGKNVKIADLAIFSLGIRNNGGAVSEELFSVVKNIKGVKLRARATGELITKSLNLEAQLKRASATTKNTGNGGTSGGGTNAGSNSSGNTSGNSSEPGNYRLVIFKYGNGTSTVKDDNELVINSNDNVASGSTVHISVVPVAGKVPVARINSNTVILTENNGTYIGSFQMPTRGTILEIYSDPDTMGDGEN